MASPDTYMESLTSLLRYHNRALPAIIPHVRDILSLCKRRWVCDFLFNEDAAHLFILTGPVYRQHAVVCKIEMCRFQPPVVPFPQNIEYEASVVMIPAFSVEQISVGFGVEEKSYRCSNVTGPEGSQIMQKDVPKHNEEFRYVRDDTTGAMVMLHDYGEYYQLEYVSHLSSTCRQRSTSRFDKHLLKHILLQAENTIIEDDSLVSALICLKISEEYRTCPVCGTRPDIPCRCRLDLAPPKHSLDFSNNDRHMASHNGEFQGLAHSGKFSFGQLQNQIVFGSRINIQHSHSPDLMNSLTNWAIQKHLQGTPADPLASVLSDVEQTWDIPQEPLMPDTVQPPNRIYQAADSSSKHMPLPRFGESSIVPLVGRNTLEDPSHDAEPSLMNAPATHVQSVRVSDALQSHSRDFANSLQPGAGSSSGRLMTTDDGSGDTIVQNVDGMARERLKELKRIEKKERNRASAHRSNMKKKRENDARKLELKRLHERETELRRRERSLRMQNLHLRNLLGPNALPFRPSR